MSLYTFQRHRLVHIGKGIGAEVSLAFVGKSFRHQFLRSSILRVLSFFGKSLRLN